MDKKMNKLIYLKFDLLAHLRIFLHELFCEVIFVKLFFAFISYFIGIALFISILHLF